MTTNTLFVSGIMPATSRTEIEDEFMKFGKCSCSFPSRGNFGFIEFEDHKEAKDAMLHIHGMKFSGERLGVDWQKRKKAPAGSDIWTPETPRAGPVVPPSSPAAAAPSYIVPPPPSAWPPPVVYSPLRLPILPQTSSAQTFLPPHVRTAAAAAAAASSRF